ncbi:MAG: alkaline phosphatase family protein [Pseudomonadota bacterium]
MRLCLFLSLFIIVNSCATRYQTTAQYGQAQREDPHTAAGKSTTILILVDGLSFQVMNSQITENKLPNSAEFFPQKDSAYSVFPTLTYPAMSSWLSTTTVDQHGIVGNVLLRGENNEQEWNLAGAHGKEYLDEVLKDKTLFQFLNNRNRPSANFSYYFGQGATSSLPKGLSSGVAYLLKNYSYLDSRALEGAQHLLENNAAEQWPSFIFIHLIGYDAIAHRQGPVSVHALDYLKKMDEKLQPLFEVIKKAEGPGREIKVVLSADHGMVTVNDYVELEKKMEEIPRHYKMLAQGRLGSFYFQKEFSAENFHSWKERFITDSKIALIAYRQGDTLGIVKNGEQTLYHYQPGDCPGANYKLAMINSFAEKTMEFCPHELVDLNPTDSPPGPPLLHDLARFFAAPGHPDAVVLAGEGVSFDKSEKGGHGAVTNEEYQIPLFSRSLAQEDRPEKKSISNILSFLRDESSIKSKFKESWQLGLASGLSQYRVEDKNTGQIQHANIFMLPTLNAGYQLVPYRFMAARLSGEISRLEGQQVHLNSAYQVKGQMGILGHWPHLSLWEIAGGWKEGWHRSSRNGEFLRLNKHGRFEAKLRTEQYLMSFSNGDMFLSPQFSYWPQKKLSGLTLSSGGEFTTSLQWRRFTGKKDSCALSFGPGWSWENNSQDRQGTINSQMAFQLTRGL